MRRLRKGDVVQITKFTDLEDPKYLTINANYVIISDAGTYPAKTICDTGREWYVHDDQCEIIGDNHD